MIGHSKYVVCVYILNGRGLCTHNCNGVCVLWCVCVYVYDSCEILLFYQNSAHADTILFVDLINKTNLPKWTEMKRDKEKENRRSRQNETNQLTSTTWINVERICWDYGPMKNETDKKNVRRINDAYGSV